MDRLIPTADLEHSGRKFLEREEWRSLIDRIDVFAGFVDIWGDDGISEMDPLVVRCL